MRERVVVIARNGVLKQPLSRLVSPTTAGSRFAMTVRVAKRFRLMEEDGTEK